MGFVYERYQDNHAILISSFQGEESNSSYFAGDNLQEAIQYFDLYQKGNQLYFHTSEEEALKTAGINDTADAAALRAKINEIVSSYSDEEALNNIVLFPNWNINQNYNVNDRVRYNNKLYKVLQAHTSLANWTPDVAVSLFAEILTNEEDPSVINDWVQPSSENAYMTGDKVRFNDAIYESLVDNNVWSPADYPAGWQLITE